MDAIWIAAAMVLAVVGGWPVTAGLLKLARSQAVRAVDAAESGGPTPAESGGLADGSETVATDAAAEEMARAPAPPSTPMGNGPDGGPAGEGGAAQGQGSAAPLPKTDVLRGGLLIGFLERGAVALAIFSGQPVAIAYVVAIKGLGRYPELKETPGASERFIIGTLASMLWAASVGVLTKVLLL